LTKPLERKSQLGLIFGFDHKCGTEKAPPLTTNSPRRSAGYVLFTQ
jgi:hypothetical protein